MTDQKTSTGKNPKFGISRRDVLKGLGISGAATLVPGMSNAVTHSISPHPSQVQAHEPATANPLLAGNALSIEVSNARSLSNDATLVQVRITNHSEHAVELKGLAPGAFKVCSKEYNLNKRLAGNPLTIRPGAEYNLWLSPEQKICASNVGACPINIGKEIPITIIERSADNRVLSHTDVVQAVIA